MQTPDIGRLPNAAFPAVAWILFAAIVGAAAARDPRPVSAASSSRIELAAAKDPQLAAQFIVARDKGFFAQEGLDVGIRFFATGGDLMVGVASGDIGIASTGFGPAVNARAGGVPIQIVAQLSDHAGAQMIIAKPGLSKPADLMGKKVGVLRGTGLELLFFEVVEAYALDASKIDVINMGGPEQVAAFARGDIQAAFLWQPHALRAQRAGGRIMLTGTMSYVPGQEGYRKIHGDRVILIARADMIAKSPVQIEAILRALAQATTFLQTNEAEAMALISKGLDMPVADLEVIMRQQVYQMVLNPDMVRDLDTQANFLWKAGKITRKIDTISWVNGTLLSKVRPEWVALPKAGP